MRNGPLIVSCANCDRVMRRVTLPANHDRAGITFLRCDDCGAQERHAIVAPSQPTRTSAPRLREAVTC